MSLILSFIMGKWKEILIVVVLSIAAYLVYDKIYNQGFEKAQQEHVQYVKQYNEDLDKRIQSIIDKSNELSAKIDANAAARQADTSKILYAAKQKPLVEYKEGKCTPSQNFLDSYNQLIDRANKK